MLEEKLAKDYEIQAHFSKRKVIEKFNVMLILVIQLVNRIFRNKMPESGQMHPPQAYYSNNFIELRFNDILNI